MRRKYKRTGFTAVQKRELWDRWQKGEGLKSIGRAFGKSSSSIYTHVSPFGGIRPRDRRRSRLSLTLAEREEISRGIVAQCSKFLSEEFLSEKQFRSDLCWAWPKVHFRQYSSHCLSCALYRFKFSMLHSNLERVMKNKTAKRFFYQTLALMLGLCTAFGAHAERTPYSDALRAAEHLAAKRGDNRFDA